MITCWGHDEKWETNKGRPKGQKVGFGQLSLRRLRFLKNQMSLTWVVSSNGHSSHHCGFPEQTRLSQLNCVFSISIRGKQDWHYLTLRGFACLLFACFDHKDQCTLRTLHRHHKESAYDLDLQQDQGKGVLAQEEAADLCASSSTLHWIVLQFGMLSHGNSCFLGWENCDYDFRWIATPTSE